MIVHFGSSAFFASQPQGFHTNVSQYVYATHQFCKSEILSQQQPISKSRLVPCHHGVGHCRGAIPCWFTLMGAFLSLSVGETVQILQQWHQYNRDETWSKRGYDIGLQSMRIDILNTVREEMRDQVTVIISSLDNLMVVATLMLSIGFGFVVEGTFPPSEKDYEYDDVQKPFLVVYAILCALSLVFPLACLMLTIAARFEVELCQQDVMGDLQKHLLKALQKDQSELLGDSSESSPLNGIRRFAASATVDGLGSFRGIHAACAAATPSFSSGPTPTPWHRQTAPGLSATPSSLTSTFVTSDSSSAKNATKSGPRGLQRGRSAPPVGQRGDKSPGTSFKDAVHSGLKRQLGTLMSADHVGHIAEDEVRLIAEGLLQKVNHYHTLYPIAQLFLWLGMLSSVLLCSVLLGLYYQANYPNTPWMWRCYSGILVACAVISCFFLVWMKFRMLREPETKIHRKNSIDTSVGASMRDFADTAVGQEKTRQKDSRCYPHMTSERGAGNLNGPQDRLRRPLLPELARRNSSSSWQRNLSPIASGTPVTAQAGSELASDSELFFESAAEELDETDKKVTASFSAPLRKSFSQDV
ncbi:unnamed protein product [Polarella glacialis]|uniref:Transmembrane protein n=1 Tax=Polarella glacialis TaxID=89957 RepID=A0A813JXK6_POLGL|nr:unnamed protein product [Polarella glacialis]